MASPFEEMQEQWAQMQAAFQQSIVARVDSYRVLKIPPFLIKDPVIFIQRCDDTVIKTVFFEYLLPYIRGILATSDSTDLDRLAKMADKITETVSDSAQCAVISLLESKPSHFEARMDRLIPEVATLAAEVKWCSRFQTRDRANKNFARSFVLRIIAYPIIGADLIAHTINPSTKFASILSEFPKVTGLEQATPNCSSDVRHHIRPRRLSPIKLKAAKAEFPHLHDCSSNLRGKVIFSKLDLHQALKKNQIPVTPEDISKTAVVTPFGLFEYKFMTYGLRNASQTFHQIFRALGDLEFVFAFIDILIASTSLEEHGPHIVLQRLKTFYLRYNIEKCEFGKQELEFLGLMINSEDCKPTLGKVQAIHEFLRPNNIVELRRFLELVNFYGKLLHNAATIQAPLNEYLRNSRKNNK
ncbi:YG31B protein, partial [Pseudoatta argentina]